METVTTRRVIRPTDGVKPVPPQRRDSPQKMVTSAALVPKRLSLWSSWLARLADFEKGPGAAVKIELAHVRALPALPNPGEVRRIHEQYLTPWLALQDTFEAAAGDEISERLYQHYATYLELRSAVFRSMANSCKLPQTAALAELDTAVNALRAFVKKQKNGSAR